MQILSKMLEAMVVTLREGVEAALVVGIVLAYLKKTQRDHLRRHVYRGLIAAVLVSIGGAFVVQKLGIDPDNELVEGSLMLAAAALVGSLLFWMWKSQDNANATALNVSEPLAASRYSLHTRIDESRLLVAVMGPKDASWCVYAVPAAACVTDRVEDAGNVLSGGLIAFAQEYSRPHTTEPVLVLAPGDQWMCGCISVPAAHECGSWMEK